MFSSLKNREITAIATVAMREVKEGAHQRLCELKFEDSIRKNLLLREDQESFPRSEDYNIYTGFIERKTKKGEFKPGEQQICIESYGLPTEVTVMQQVFEDLIRGTGCYIPPPPESSSGAHSEFFDPSAHYYLVTERALFNAEVFFRATLKTVDLDMKKHRMPGIFMVSFWKDKRVVLR